MKELLSIFVRGDPQPMPRARAGIVAGHVHMYTAERYGRDDTLGRSGHKLPWLVWKEAVVRTILSQHRPAKVQGPIRLDCDFYLPRPDRLCKPGSPRGRILHAQKPDKDNLEKLIMDALTTTEVYADDGQVCQGEPQKWYHALGDATGARIVVTLLSDPEEGLF